MDANYQKLMSGGDVFQMSKRIAGQTLDRLKIGRKLGSNEDLVQSVAEILLQVQVGEVVFDPDRVARTRVGEVVDPNQRVSFAGFVMDKVRWTAKKNWMLEAPWDVQETAQPGAPADSDSDSDGDDDKKIEPPQLQTVTARAAGADAQSEDVGDDDGLTPTHQLLKYSDSATLADLLECTTRTVVNMLGRASDGQVLSKIRRK